MKVYKISYELALSMYKFSKTLPKEETYGVINQIRRASLSIPLNIAEGYGKQAGNAEFSRYLKMAKGSCNEMMVLISFVKDLEYLDEIHYSRYREEYEEVEKMLYGLIKSVKD